MKRIAIFCDGTWNRPDATHPTNVFHLHRIARRTAADGTTQILKYIPGVGTGFGKSGWRKHADRIIGGAFGVGVTANILAGYTFLIEQYEPGDEIFVFGFSRGAFTARSLVGLIRASGLPRHTEAWKAGEALKRYRSNAPETKPSSEESHRFRLGYSPDVVTSQKEADWRAAQGLVVPPLLTVTYLGIWDTVGALGIPGHYKWLSSLFNRSQGFHDTQLSGMVMAARHAVSIDERRKSFPPTLWGNLGELNREDPERKRNYQQLWFAGDHGSVGGGGDITGLSNITLRWVVEGAMAQGLEFDPTALAVFAAEENPLEPSLFNQSAPPSLSTRLLRRRVLDRAGRMEVPDPATGGTTTVSIGPDYAWDISPFARTRYASLPGYRPPALTPFHDDLTAPDP
ncbi:DUF2235 domain-containing protein [Vannielia litorea]|uniref:Uncharacterized protein, PA2063/DUF2235 family n=1 Tax=Vannielia litorea TaxID=1217970 RepID=A0A1N6FCB6_9RHOB|nr:DUF2235 domain-containing protein [Vannielia litorea]SIN92941.1 Uncharacterized protein, PA2063/DUF2235 family [Vannielia litorea]